MKKWILLLLVLFTARVKVPFGADETYRHIKSIDFVADGHMLKLIFLDDSYVLVPSMWTVVEPENEKKKDRDND